MRIATGPGANPGPLAYKVLLYVITVSLMSADVVPMTGRPLLGYHRLTMTTPTKPKIYHIAHVDRLPSIVSDGYLWCDRVAMQSGVSGTTIGMNDIKQRRLNVLTLDSHPGLYVGDCVPFYFCPRSVMLYVIYMANNSNLSYTGGQEPIVHLEADLHDVVNWANGANHKWAFTTSNAGSYHFADFSGLTNLNKIKWSAVAANDWRDPDVKEGKQAEFLIEHSFPWTLVSRIGVHSRTTQAQALAALESATHQPPVHIRRDWYY